MPTLISLHVEDIDKKILSNMANAFSEFFYELMFAVDLKELVQRM